MDLGDIVIGTAISVNGEVYLVQNKQHVKMGRGGAVVKAKLRHLFSGATTERTIKPSDTLIEIELERRPATHLFSDQHGLHFMDTTTFDQFTLPRTIAGSTVQFLKEGQNVTILSADNRPVSCELPIKVDLAVRETPPNVKGNTAQGGSKPAILETGATVSVPLFIKEGDNIRVNTTDGSYVERVK